jgi:deoxyadenosine/deoxycytidine kinase
MCHCDAHTRVAVESDMGEVVAVAQRPLVPPFSVAVEGPIGIGKTTILSKIESAYGDSVHVHKEDVDEGSLNLFYTNPSKYALYLQTAMLERRLSQRREGVYRLLDQKKAIWWDRSVRGDQLFCTLNMMYDRIEALEYETYNARLGAPFHPPALCENTTGIQHVLYLSDSPTACKARADAREVKRKTARPPIPLGYFEALDDLHFHQAIYLASTDDVEVRVLEWGSYQSAQDVVNHIKNPDRRCKVNFVSGYASDPSARQVFLPTVTYDHPEDLEAPMPWPSERGYSATVVFACRTAMTRPTPPGIVNNPFGIGFYIDAFKRRIMAHMARGDRICFY